MIHIHDNTDNEPHRTVCGKYAHSSIIVEPENRKQATCPECLKAVAQTHRCEGRLVDYMRGTPCGTSGQCKAAAKVVRAGKHYCLLHDPEQKAERQKKRDQKWQERMDKLTKTYGFRVDNLRIYEIPAYSEMEAKSILVDRILEVKIECLGEVKK